MGIATITENVGDGEYKAITTKDTARAVERLALLGTQITALEERVAIFNIEFQQEKAHQNTLRNKAVIAQTAFNTAASAATAALAQKDGNLKLVDTANGSVINIPEHETLNTALNVLEKQNAVADSAAYKLNFTRALLSTAKDRESKFTIAVEEPTPTRHWAIDYMPEIPLGSIVKTVEVSQETGKSWIAPMTYKPVADDLLIEQALIDKATNRRGVLVGERNSTNAKIAANINILAALQNALIAAINDNDNYEIDSIEQDIKTTVGEQALFFKTKDAQTRKIEKIDAEIVLKQAEKDRISAIIVADEVDKGVILASTKQVQPVLASSPEATFYNKAILPGLQQWRPVFRKGTITAINYGLDTCTVLLKNEKSSQLSLPINKDHNIIVNVPVRYGECNAAVFLVDDLVIIGFRSDWNTPVVVGFQKEPEECLNYILGVHASPQPDNIVAVLEAGQPLRQITGVTNTTYKLPKTVKNLPEYNTKLECGYVNTSTQFGAVSWDLGKGEYYGLPVENRIHAYNLKQHQVGGGVQPPTGAYIQDVFYKGKLLLNHSHHKILGCVVIPKKRVLVIDIKGEWSLYNRDGSLYRIGQILNFPPTINYYHGAFYQKACFTDDSKKGFFAWRKHRTYFEKPTTLSITYELYTLDLVGEDLSFDVICTLDETREGVQDLGAEYLTQPAQGYPFTFNGTYQLFVGAHNNARVVYELTADTYGLYDGPPTNVNSTETGTYSFNINGVVKKTWSFSATEHHDNTGLNFSSSGAIAMVCFTHVDMETGLAVISEIRQDVTATFQVRIREFIPSIPVVTEDSIFFNEVLIKTITHAPISIPTTLGVLPWYYEQLLHKGIMISDLIFDVAKVNAIATSNIKRGLNGTSVFVHILTLEYLKMDGVTKVYLSISHVSGQAPVIDLQLEATPVPFFDVQRDSLRII